MHPASFPKYLKEASIRPKEGYRHSPELCLSQEELAFFGSLYTNSVIPLELVEFSVLASRESYYCFVLQFQIPKAVAWFPCLFSACSSLLKGMYV